jgi:hypothetical protein
MLIMRGSQAGELGKITFAIAPSRVGFGALLLVPKMRFILMVVGKERITEAHKGGLTDSVTEFDF